MRTEGARREFGYLPSENFIPIRQWSDLLQQEMTRPLTASTLLCLPKLERPLVVGKSIAADL
jgi:hypothetical protein